ncbi:hypothetical protein LMG28614_00463 [Paraburkholderia ultramafica]|uniref:Uncharacterized protein n=1 Tax=Paraburkholderia ultramafica TaxID=1544867 RepID=A0A6S7BZN9_9BURK|nr:hypothetical protein LMG28614_00463 [Paraburkholderia ultramafica]
MLDERIHGAFGGRIGRQRADRCTRRERRQQDHAAALAHHRQQLLHEKVRRAHVHGEQIVEIFDGRFLDTDRFRNAGVRDQNVEALTDHRAYLFRQRVRTVRVAQIRGDLLRVAASRANFGDHGVRFFFSAAVVNENLRARFGECEGAGAADAA